MYVDLIRGGSVQQALQRVALADGDPCMADYRPTLAVYNEFMPLSEYRCTHRKTRFYYDPSAGKCNSFVFTGCHRSSNLFATLVQCKELCSGE